ncbi:MAG TPA: DUF58 domain-containing protein [Planctomycetota bacterium]|nr:DUF58 domain-containing protein [Planctomycetota bacterium]
MPSAYLRPDVVGRAEALGLRARTLVEGLRVGDHKSPYHGFSVEFAQHREYVPGDDVRYVDWRVWGRSERYVIKQFEQETNFYAHLLLDASRSMLYGEGEQNKLEYAKTLVASLAYLIVAQRDGAGLYVFDAAWRAQLPPAGQPGHVQEILRTLESVEPREKTAIGPLLHELADRLRRRGLVFLITDAFDEVPPLLDGLRHLRFQGHEVILFHVLHPDEIAFPFDGMVKFDGMEEPVHLLTRPRLVRPTYLRALEEWLHELRQGCEAHRVDYVLVDTSRPVAETLTGYLARRLRVRRI